jgi:hypothetical protein
MKYIITENQQIETFQKILDMSVSLLKDKCDEIVRMGADAEEIVSFDVCDELESIKKIKVVDTKIDLILCMFSCRFIM